jgi:hypothetical protein
VSGSDQAPTTRVGCGCSIRWGEKWERNPETVRSGSTTIATTIATTVCLNGSIVQSPAAKKSGTELLPRTTSPITLSLSPSTSVVCVHAHVDVRRTARTGLQHVVT